MGKQKSKGKIHSFNVPAVARNFQLQANVPDHDDALAGLALAAGGAAAAATLAANSVNRLASAFSHVSLTGRIRTMTSGQELLEMSETYILMSIRRFEPAHFHGYAVGERVVEALDKSRLEAKKRLEAAFQDNNTQSMLFIAAMNSGMLVNNLARFQERSIEIGKMLCSIAERNPVVKYGILENELLLHFAVWKHDTINKDEALLTIGYSGVSYSRTVGAQVTFKELRKILEDVISKAVEWRTLSVPTEPEQFETLLSNYEGRD